MPVTILITISQIWIGIGKEKRWNCKTVQHCTRKMILLYQRKFDEYNKFYRGNYLSITYTMLPNIRIVHITLLKSAADYILHIYCFQILHFLSSTDTSIIMSQIH